MISRRVLYAINPQGSIKKSDRIVDTHVDGNIWIRSLWSGNDEHFDTIKCVHEQLLGEVLGGGAVECVLAGGPIKFNGRCARHNSFDCKPVIPNRGDEAHL